jgi:small-conductance mechanosensitive channel
MFPFDTVDWQPLAHDAVQFLPRLLIGAVVLLLFWFGGNLSQRLITRLAGLRSTDPSLVAFFSQTARLTLLVIGVITALGTLGVDVSALVAGLGLTGFAVGFAMKDMISNALSGILVLVYNPFRHGDHISVTALEGTVVEINFRYTVLDAGEQWIYVPNSNLFTNPVTVKKRASVQPS